MTPSSVELARIEDQAVGLVELMHQKVIHAPINNPAFILDVGCGTAAVTCYLGSKFPYTQVYGIDISPVRSSAPIPQNVSFIQGDLKSLLKEKDARLRRNSFDYIFHRLLILGVTDWSDYVSDVASLLQPGGWAEMQDYNIKMYRNGRECSQEWQWLKILKKAASRKGIDLDCGSNIKGYMERAGFTDVVAREYSVPFGGWASDMRPETKRIGQHAGREYGPMYFHLMQEAAKSDMSEELGKEIVFYVTIGRKPEMSRFL